MTYEKPVNALALAALLAGCASPGNPPPADFAFVFEYGMCSTDVLDTFENTYTKDMIVDPPVWIPLALTAAEMQAVYDTMMKINFFGYPADFQAAAPGDEIVALATPAMDYRLTVRSGGQVKVVQWSDKVIEPVAPEAGKLRELAGLILQVIQSRAEVLQLDAPSAACQ